MDDGTSFIATSHGGPIDDSDEVVDDTEFHVHQVMFTAGCVSGVGTTENGFENGDAKITPHRVTVDNAILDGSSISAALTGFLDGSFCWTTWDS